MKDSLILFGGTFDPIHKGHLLVARNALKELKASKVIFIPAKNPRWKNPTDSNHRLNMLKLGLMGEKDFEISTVEMDSTAPISYSADTVQYFRSTYPNTKLYFLMGFDQLDRLDEWHDIQTIVQNAQIVAYARPGFPKNHEAVKKYKVKVMEYSDLIDLSSTDIRSLKSLMTKKSVIDYIIENDLYFTKTVQGYYEPRRYKHAISVANLCYRMAQTNHLEPTKAYQAGYLHDIGKLMAHEADAPRMMAKYYPKYKDYPLWAWHQFLGEMITKYFFAIHERTILNAIEYHTTGNKNMSKYAKIVFCSDKLDPLRGYDSSELINDCLMDIDSGFVEVLKNNKKFLERAGSDSDNNKLTVACYKEYLKGKKK